MAAGTVTSDEIWHFLEGGPLELFAFDPRLNKFKSSLVGPFSTKDCQPIHVVPAGYWQAARPKGKYTLVSCTVGPGFEFEDFTFVADIPGHEKAFEDQLRELRHLL